MENERVPTNLKFHSYLCNGESLSPTPSHLHKLDSFYFKVVRCALGKKSSFYHRVLHPSQATCSNASLQQTLWSNNVKTLTPSQIVHRRQLQLLGHMIRNPNELVSSSTFNALGVFRGSSRDYRRGAPRLHWTETTSTIASRRLSFMQATPALKPSYRNINHTFYDDPNRVEIQARLGPSATTRTAIPVPILRAAKDRATWRTLL